MESVIIPLRVKDGQISRTEVLKKSINDFMHMLLTTPKFSVPADPQFGFVFNNLRFEIFNENEGVVYNSGDTTDYGSLNGLYDKKISGSSKNLNTFAAELKKAVLTYEKRLEDVTVTMTYIREERQIYTTVKGVIAETGANYTFTTKYKVWNL